MAAKALPRSNLAHVALTLQPFAAGLTHLVQLTSAPDGSGHIYIAEQAGLILVADANGRRTPSRFWIFAPRSSLAGSGAC
jgi:hypothetical protein